MTKILAICPSSSRDEEAATAGYTGKGTAEDPFIVEFIHRDPRNPFNFPSWQKWFITSISITQVFAISATSSGYSASAAQITQQTHASAELFEAGISLIVLGFALGPAFWAPISEFCGRRYVTLGSLFCMTVCVGATAGCDSIAPILVLRFLAGAFGASPLTNAGGTIADMFPASERGVAMSIFGLAPFLGPMLAPVIAGFVTITIGWRWAQGIFAFLVGFSWLFGLLFQPETYGPVLLRRRAARLSKQTGQAYISVLDKHGHAPKASQVFERALKWPWVLLFWEPIVLVTSLYLAVVYGIVYMFLPVFPIVYEQERGWNAGVGSLPFLSIATGEIIGTIYFILDDKFRCSRLGMRYTPESRMVPAIAGAIALPIGLFGFAWTNSPSIHWSASVILTAPFGFGVCLLFVSIFVYLLDSYAIYAASVLASGAISRATLGAAFPLFTTYMYRSLGIHWASTIPAMLTLVFVPFPIVMYRYGATIRMKCRYAKEAALLTARMKARDTEVEAVNDKRHVDEEVHQNEDEFEKKEDPQPGVRSAKELITSTKSVQIT